MKITRRPLTNSEKTNAFLIGCRPATNIFHPLGNDAEITSKLLAQQMPVF